MIVLGLLMIVCACYLGYKIKQDRFNRTNAHGILEYESFGKKIGTDVKNGVMNFLSVVIGLIGAIILVWQIAF